MGKQFKCIYFSESNDPYVNLAIEDELLLKLAPKESALFIYINEPSVVMGRFQNPWIETNIEQLKQHNVHLVRRQSGGGCVYHDLGNLNFCFLHGTRDYHKNYNSRFLQEFLRRFNIATILNERSDITLDVDSKIYKFSGSAFKQKKDRSFHHCTMLINSDLGRLNSILDSPLKILSSKSTPSNPVAVKNLNEVENSLTTDKVINSLKEFGDEFKLVSLDLKNSSYLEKLTSRKWILGETPLFECEVELSDGVVSLKFRKGEIVSAESDALKFRDFCSKLIGLNILEREELVNCISSSGFSEEFVKKLDSLQLI